MADNVLSPAPVARWGGISSAEFALAVGGFGIGTGEFAIMGLLPQVAGDMGVSVPFAGHVISAYAIGVVVGAPLLAVLAAKFSRHNVLLTLMSLFALGNLASALAGSFGLLVAARFLAGLPHGAYFGVAALVAAGMALPHQRARAIGRVMMGLTVATLLGTPLAAWFGQALGWRAAFGIVGAISVLTVVLTWFYVPRDHANPTASPLTELGALGKSQVWLTLGICAIGIALVFNLVAYVMFYFTMNTPWMAVINVLLIGGGFAVVPGIQMRLINVAGEAQTLAAALSHSAFNLANALGAWLGGLSIAAGYGWTSTGLVGAMMSVAGIGIFFSSVLLDRSRAARTS